MAPLQDMTEIWKTSNSKIKLPNDLEIIKLVKSLIIKTTVFIRNDMFQLSISHHHVTEKLQQSWYKYNYYKASLL